MPDRNAAPIFVVDDDPGALNSLRFMLESEGYRVQAFLDGPALLAALPLQAATCIIIDVKMPNMDGFALLGHLHVSDSQTPVVLLTGHPDPTIRTRAAELGLMVVEKPFSQDGIILAIEDARSRGPGGPAAT